ncbi:hypothetical protein AB5I41_31265 [Sphingomonas sp. MMS24-JH45]
MKVPELLNISGSANWANKADYGLTYHRARPDRNRAELRVTKVRMGLPGKKGNATIASTTATARSARKRHDASKRRHLPPRATGRPAFRERLDSPQPQASGLRLEAGEECKGVPIAGMEKSDGQ